MDGADLFVVEFGRDVELERADPGRGRPDPARRRRCRDWLDPTGLATGRSGGELDEIPAFRGVDFRKYRVGLIVRRGEQDGAHTEFGTLNANLDAIVRSTGGMDGLVGKCVVPRGIAACAIGRARLDAFLQHPSTRVVDVRRTGACQDDEQYTGSDACAFQHCHGV